MLRPPLAGFSREASGNLPRRDMVGRFARAHGFWSGVSQARGHSSIGCSESQPHRNSGMCSLDKQSEVGTGARKCSAVSTADGVAEGFRCKRVPNHHPGQESSSYPGRKTFTSEARIADLWDWDCFGPINGGPLSRGTNQEDGALPLAEHGEEVEQLLPRNILFV